ncbi:oleate hydratase [Clostridium estertheticum]|uniref:oleate hydratase n=1 Tax=Clostridium estertheticum TaxID=238834 RepID=UPI001C7D292D|nr:oleate hydratase [Clostridium estertheticum]MBX4264859.1 oleate hydratase [Clostridium estertheticum]WLC88339.1 oleate hydratase [Clostridium estertheticum]
MKFNFDQTIDVEKTNAYMVGAGLASMAAAIYLIRDGHVPGKNIHIYEELDITGGSMDGNGNAKDGYVIRGGRMFDREAYACTFGIMESIPSLTDPKVSIMDEFNAFNKEIHTHAKARLIDNDANILDVSTLGFNREDRMALMDIMINSEDSLGTKTIKECFPEAFFKTNFWLQWTTLFAFETWHSAVELKRYLHRFIQELPRLKDLSGIRRTPYNQYDSMLLPMTKWLKSQGVNFELNCRVTDLEFKPSDTQTTVTAFKCLKNGKETRIEVGACDLAFATIGSLTAGTSLGSMTKPAIINDKHVGGAWDLWEKIADGRPQFGNPKVFDERVEESMWESFTVTLKDPTMYKKIIEFSGNQPGTGAHMTFRDSAWLMTIVLHNQPHFIGQADEIQIIWGYSLFPYAKGDFIKKRMVDCSGAEILSEVLYHLNFKDDMKQIIETSICIPCILPFTTAQFLTRSKGDRPQNIPEGSTNLALLGQFCEIKDDVVFTMDYSVRGAQIAVYKFLNLNKRLTPIYKGQHDVRVMLNSVLEMMKDDNLSKELLAIKSLLK